MTKIVETGIYDRKTFLEPPCVVVVENEIGSSSSSLGYRVDGTAKKALLHLGRSLVHLRLATCSWNMGEVHVPLVCTQKQFARDKEQITNNKYLGASSSRHQIRDPWLHTL